MTDDIQSEDQFTPAFASGVKAATNDDRAALYRMWAAMLRIGFDPSTALERIVAGLKTSVLATDASVQRRILSVELIGKEVEKFFELRGLDAEGVHIYFADLLQSNNFVLGADERCMLMLTFNEANDSLKLARALGAAAEAIKITGRP
jgi:hypothetical protein